MADFFGKLHQFPCGGKDRFVPLLLPELDVEGAVGEPTLYQTGFPRRIWGNTHVPSQSVHNTIRISSGKVGLIFASESVATLLIKLRED